MRSYTVMFVGACAALLVTLNGCISMDTGQDFDMTKAHSFQNGKTTRADIIAALGKPTSTDNSDSGTSITYTYGQSSANVFKNMGAAYGFGVMKTKSNYKSCTFSFDASDKLKKTECSEGTRSTGRLGS